MSISTEINISNIQSYLKFNGWSKVPTNYEGLSAFINPDNRNLYVTLPNNDIPASEQKSYIDEAINLISNINNQSREQVIVNIEFLNYDQHSYRLDQNRNSIPLTLFESLMLSTRETLRKSLKEIYDTSNIQSNSKSIDKNELVNRFLEESTFPHTWRGSFGLSINTPVQTESISIFNDEKDSETLSRRASLSLAETFKILNISAQKRSTGFILDQFKDSTSLLKAHKPFTDILEHIKKNEFEYRLNLSPTLKGGSYKKFNNTFSVINESTLTRLVYALDEVKSVEEESNTINFRGFPVNLKSDKKSILDQTSEGTREVSVKGLSNQIGQRTLKFNMQYSDYKKAIHAHDEGKSLHIKCRVTPKHNTYKVEEIDFVKLVED